MAKQKRNRKKSTKGNVSSGINHEIIALIIISAGLVMGISLFTSGAGLFGKAFRRICMGLMGYIVYAIPLFIIVYGIQYLIKRENFNNKCNFWSFFGLLVSLSAIEHIFLYKSDREAGFRDSIIFFYDSGIKGESGGVIGGLVAEPVINMFGIWGAGVIFMTCTIVFIMLITQISFAKIISFMFSWIRNLFARIGKSLSSQMKEVQKQLEEEKIEDSVERDDILVEQDMIESSQSDSVEPEIEIFDPHLPEENDMIEKQHAETIKPAKKSLSKAQKENVATEEIGPIDTKNEQIQYMFPPIELLSGAEQMGDKKESINDLRNNAKKLVETLKSFGVEAKVLQVSKGPAVTRYELQPSAGVKVSKIVNLADDIALNLAALGVRIEAPIPGKAAVGIEVPNKDVTPVHLREVIESEEFSKHPSKLAFALGKDIAGKAVVTDIARMPHLLIAGATGSGKSVCINTLITSILYKASPNEVKLVMVDPKVVELGVYNGIPHLLIPVVTDPKKAAGALNWAVQEMVNRYKLFADNNVRDLKGYNMLLKEKGEENILPHIIIIIDELADLMMVAPNDVEDAICRLAQMARAAGMHLVIATQRPSVDVITGVIKANIPSRISFAVSSQVDSRTILDMAGAEKLLGKGDMLFYPVGAAKPVRLQGAFVSDKEVESIVEYVKSHSGANYHEDIIEQIERETEPEQEDEGDADELLPQAIELVVESGQASVSMLQRKLKVGYARAARLVDQMEARGIVGGFEGSKPRQVLITRQQYNEMLMNRED